MGTMELLSFWVGQCFFWATGAIFTNPMQKRKQFAKRIGCFAIIVLAYSGLIQFLLLNHSGNVYYLSRLLRNPLMVVFIFLCWDVHISVAVYNAVWAVSIWEILVEVASAIRLQAEPFYVQHPYSSLLIIIVFFLSLFLLFAKTIAVWMPFERKDKIGPRQLTSALLIFGVIEVLACSEELRNITDYNGQWKILLMSQLMGLIVLYLQSEMFKKSAMRQEMAMMNLLWEKERDQYELTKENINLINQKSHDLKHQIRALRKVSKEEFDRYLNEIEDAVRIYETIVKTGNDVFDTILTEKSLYCMSREIQVSCVADGSQMDFIENIDLYAILGNAMDNAIQAVEKFQEPEKRQIDVMIHRQQNFLVMNFINPMPEQLVYDEDELPVSTKKDKRYHGYGLRSIRHFVKKYDGFMNVSEEDGCFSLKIMIPIPSETVKTR